MPSIERYVTPLRLPMSVDAFWRLPRVAGYRAEYRDGHAELAYAPRLSMARLRVAPRVGQGGADVGSKSNSHSNANVTIRPFDPVGGGPSHEALAKLFMSAFARVAPLGSMPATTRRHAADAALRHTAAGGDGPVFAPACLLAHDAAGGDLVGAAIVTRLHLRADEWPEPALPPVLVNLTWLMVTPGRQRRGIATALLDRVMNVLAEHELPWLVSHVLEDNVPAVMFHWRSGFELVRKIEG